MIGTVAYGFVRHPSAIMTWLALPEHLSSWRDPLHSLVAVLQAFTYQGPHVPELWLGNLALIDWFVLAMFVAGIVFYARHWKASRTHLLASFFATSIVVCALLGPVSYGLVLVIIYLVAIAGIAYVLQFWLKVFPRNPLARSFGVAVVSCAIGLSCLYGLTQYFVAWPHNPDTQSLYYQQSHLPREQPAKS
jgi:NADH:ubiquinone oxidoreductase subunit 6 (subunit J)